jgi:hypothetical protein
LVAKPLELAGTDLGHAANALAGVDAGDRALAQPVIEAIGVAILNPEPLRGAELIVLLWARRILEVIRLSHRAALACRQSTISVVEPSQDCAGSPASPANAAGESAIRIKAASPRMLRMMLMPMGSGQAAWR